MNLFDQILGGDYWIGVCDECRQSKTFATERERELWSKYHTHEPNA